MRNERASCHAPNLRSRDRDCAIQQIATIACKCESYIREYIRLVDRGEERLIQGVEQEVFPILFAVLVVSADDAQIQHVLMDAFDEGLVTTHNFAQARKIITARSRDSERRQHDSDYTVVQLKRDIEEATQVKTSYVREAKTRSTASWRC